MLSIQLYGLFMQDCSHERLEESPHTAAPTFLPTTMAFEALDAFVGDHFLRVVVPLNVLLLDRFYSPGAGFCGMLVRWVDANDVRAKCVSSNMRPGNEPLGIGPEMDSEMWAINNAIFLHHTPGAFLAFVGWYCGSTGFVRLGLALEIGENFLHYAQMLMTKIAPSLQWGPWALYPAVVWALLIAHHSLGFFGGPFSHFFLMEDVDFQFLVRPDNPPRTSTQKRLRLRRHPPPPVSEPRPDCVP